MQKVLQKWYGRHKVLCWVLAGLIILYTLAGFVIAPLIIDHTIRNKVSQSLGRDVKVDGVRVNPYTFTVRLTGLSVAEQGEGEFIRVGDIHANVDPLISMFKWGAVVHSVEITDPKVRILRTGPDQFNFSDLIPPAGNQTPDQESQPSKPIRLVLKAFSLTGGEIRYEDKAQSLPFESTLSDLNISLEQLDTAVEAGAAFYELSARSEAGEQLEVRGRADVAPLNVAATVQLDDVSITKYLPYYQGYLKAGVTGGTLGVQTRLTWSDDLKTMADIVFTLSKLTLVTNTKEELVSIPHLQVSGAAIDLNAQRVQVGSITTRDGRINVAFNPEGILNLQAAISPPPKQSNPSAPAASEKSAPRDSEWLVDLTEFALDNYAVRYQDQRTAPMADIALGNIRIDARSLSNRKSARGKADLSMQWADQGTLSLGGEIALIPLQADLEIEADSMDIRPLQPYLNEHIQLVVTEGLLNTKGRLKIGPADAEEDMDIQYTGEVALNRFKSVDRPKTGAFLNWKSLYLNGINLGTAPFRLNVKELALTDFYNRLTINADGTSNLAAITGKEKKPAGQPSKGADGDQKTNNAGEAADIKIQTVTLQGGKVDFSDLSVKPNVRLPMEKIGGRISGLDAIKTNKADVLLKGEVGGNVPLEIRGEINPLIEKPFVDLTIGLKGVDLSPFTPYSGKYLGYKLDKGQLSLDLAYQVAENKLDAKNKVQLNQLTLGETVTSPEATKLPIKLAIALLKDRNGNIDLDLPITGDLDDPEFSIGGIVGKMFVNLIVSIVSSPFKILGGLFGGGEELAYLDFEHGQSAIPDENIGKLDTLAKILYERPGLKLEIQGQVHPEQDTEGLRIKRFEEQLKAAKLKSMIAWGKQAVPLEQIELTPEEREKLVKKAYKAAKFPKPRDEQGKRKKLTSLEMEKLLYTAIEITADDLRLLAHQRASAAKEYLAGKSEVSAQRLFIVEPKIEPGDGKDELLSRVKFNLT